MTDRIEKSLAVAAVKFKWQKDDKTFDYFIPAGLVVNVGDKVIYSKYGGTEVKYAGEEYLILSARDVLAVVS